MSPTCRDGDSIFHSTTPVEHLWLVPDAVLSLGGIREQNRQRIPTPTPWSRCVYGDRQSAMPTNFRGARAACIPWPHWAGDILSFLAHCHLLLGTKLSRVGPGSQFFTVILPPLFPRAQPQASGPLARCPGTNHPLFQQNISRKMASERSCSATHRTGLDDSLE